MKGKLNMTENDSKKKFYEATGQNIKKYRDIRNYSLQTLAEKVGLTKKTISRYENGEIKINMDRLRDIAKALNVEVVQLTEGTGVFTLKEDRGVHSPLDKSQAELQVESKLMNELKLLADERGIDLSDPKTLDLLKDALDLIKRVRGE